MKSNCPICGKGSLVHKQETIPVEYRGCSGEVLSLYSVCTTCGSEQATKEEAALNKTARLVFEEQIDTLLLKEQLYQELEKFGVYDVEVQENDCPEQDPWETGELGRDEEFVSVVPCDEQMEIDIAKMIGDYYKAEPLSPDLLDRMEALKVKAEEALVWTNSRKVKQDISRKPQALKKSEIESLRIDLKNSFSDFARLDSELAITNPFFGEDMSKAFHTLEESREKRSKMPRKKRGDQ